MPGLGDLVFSYLVLQRPSIEMMRVSDHDEATLLGVFRAPVAPFSRAGSVGVCKYEPTENC